MLIVMHPQATEGQIETVIEQLYGRGFEAHRSDGETRTVIGAVGADFDADPRDFLLMDGVVDVLRITEPYKLASRTFKPEATVVQLGDVPIGGPDVTLMAGPCTIESREQVFAAAEQVRAAGAVVLRGGAFKPRTSPYSFQGMGEEGLQILRDAADAFGMFAVTEVMDVSRIELVGRYTDIFQVGARNMQNYALLKELGAQDKPVLLKRGLSATIKELLLSAEYLLSSGNRQVLLCERGIRTYETSTRFTLDISSIPVLKSLTHLPVIVDPSHATGIRTLVAPVARAAIAAGADGLLIEVHCDPESAVCDGAQSLFPYQYHQLAGEIRAIAKVVGRGVVESSRPPAAD
jgi:3-deoxy-7-phosphoheptulonate synthase